MIEHAYELRLREPQPAGAIFALKHMGWSDGREPTVRRDLASAHAAQPRHAARAGAED